MSENTTRDHLRDESREPVTLARVLADFHPFRCAGKGNCIHCDKVRADGHDPDDCRQCEFDPDEVQRKMDSALSTNLSIEVPAKPFYGGLRTPTGTIVFFNAGGDEDARVIDPRVDLFNHSPSGLEWGYSGSGPAQLALAILAHYFARYPDHAPPTLERWPSEDDLCATDVAAIRVHQSFKFKAIASIQTDEWFLSDEDIHRVLQSIKP